MSEKAAGHDAHGAPDHDAHEAPETAGHDTRKADLFDRIEHEEPADLFERVDLDMALKDDLYELVGDAVKSAMRLREGFPVRLTAPFGGVPADPGANRVIDLYLLEMVTLIDAYWEKIATRVAHFVNEELTE